MIPKKIWRVWFSVFSNELMDDYAAYDFDHPLTEEEIASAFKEFEKDYPALSVCALQLRVELVYYVPEYHFRNKN